MHIAQNSLLKALESLDDLGKEEFFFFLRIVDDSQNSWEGKTWVWG